MKKLASLLVLFSILFALPGTGNSNLLEPNDPFAFDFFGISSSIFGDYAVVGAIGEDPLDNEFTSPNDFSGSIYIFHHGATGWQQQQKLTVDTGGNDFFWFGCAVDIYEDTVIAGAYGDETLGMDAGSAYIFVRSGGTWTEQAHLLPADVNDNDQFGWDAAIYGDYAVIGAPSRFAIGEGAAYIYKRVGTVWTQQARLTASDASNDDGFGTAVDISGDYVIVGSGKEAAYIFMREGENWTQQAKLVSSDGGAGPDQNFGLTSVAIHPDHAIVGACGDNSDRGAAYIFKRNGQDWVEQQKLSIHEDLLTEEFGYAVAISDRYAVATWGYGQYGFVFEVQNDTWTLVTTLVNDMGGYEGGLGLYGDSILWGNPWDMDNGNQSGSAWIFSIVTAGGDTGGGDTGGGDTGGSTGSGGSVGSGSGRARGDGADTSGATSSSNMDVSSLVHGKSSGCFISNIAN